MENDGVRTFNEVCGDRHKEHDEFQVQTSQKRRTWWATSKDHGKRRRVERHGEQSKGLRIKRKKRIQWVTTSNQEKKNVRWVIAPNEEEKNMENNKYIIEK